MSPCSCFAPGITIIGHLLHPPHRITRPPLTIDGEHLSAVPHIVDQVSTLVPYVFLLLVQQQDTIPDPFHRRFFLNAERHRRVELRSGESPLAIIPFEVLV
jgi:hypothetical protein